MKVLLILLAVILLLSGCQAAYPNEYLSIREHEAPFAYKETAAASTESRPEPAEKIRTVSHAINIRDAIKELVNNGQETGTFRCVNYNGSVQEDMQKMSAMLLQADPKYSYAMDSLDWSIEESAEGVFIKVNLKLRFTPDELADIQTKLSPGLAMNEIYEALRSGANSITIQISGYQETDFVAVLEEYILQHPDEIVEAPEIYVSVFPDRGNVRVVELRFVHKTDQETLRQHSQQTRTALELTANLAAQARSAQELVETLYKQLVSISYESGQDATVYSLVIQKVGSSRTMASAAAYLCRQAGWECQIVKGERNGESWYWNRILTDGRWVFFDLHTAALEKQSPSLLPDTEMDGYSWDETLYPPNEEQLPEAVTTEPEAPTAEPEAPTAESEAPTAEPEAPTAEASIETP